MTLEEKKPFPTYFAKTFVNVDEDDAATVGLDAPKKENRWCLLEVSKDILAALEAGESFHIKEYCNSSAALCTSDKTFAIEFLENSNPMYLGGVAVVEPTEADKGENQPSENANKENVGNASNATAGDAKAAGKEEGPRSQCTIFAQCRGNIFLKSASADSQRVRDLLSPYPLDTSGATPGTGRNPFTLSSLQFQVAASPKELQRILESGPYVERDGCWYWMPAAFEREVADVALNLISLNSLDVTALDVEFLLGKVQEHFGKDYVPSSEILCNALRTLAKDADAKKDDTGAAGEAVAAEVGRLSLDSEKIKIFQAAQLLREVPARIRERFDLAALPPRPKRPRLGGSAPGPGRDNSLSIEEFCTAFSQLNGSEMTIEELSKLLGDRMYIDEIDGAVHPLDATTLPLDPRERLKRLFELSSHWRPERLTPLIAPTVHGVKVDAWLLKYVKIVFIEFEKDKEVRMMTNKFVGLSSWK